MSNFRIKRLEKELLKFMNNIITYKLRDKNLQWVTINDLKLSKDMSHARIYFSYLNKSSKKQVLASLTKSAGFIKNELASAKIMRIIPDIQFFYDDLGDKARHLDELIEQIHSDGDHEN